MCLPEEMGICQNYLVQTVYGRSATKPCGSTVLFLEPSFILKNKPFLTNARMLSFQHSMSVRDGTVLAVLFDEWKKASLMMTRKKNHTMQTNIRSLLEKYQTKPNSMFFQIFAQ